jgi:acyl-CoA thioester hydrolase
MNISPRFRHKTPIQIRFKDADMMGHVNNANHFTYFELARVQYFNDIVNLKIDWNKEGIILAHMEIDYILPILINDRVFVYTRISKIGKKSFEAEYLIVKENNNELTSLASGKSVQVCFNYETSMTIPVPAIWKDLVLAYEPEPPALG